MQVKVHILAGLTDLGKADIRDPPLEKNVDKDHRDTLIATLKLLGEICMEERPPKHRKALTAFTSAIPGLPKFDNVLLTIPNAGLSWEDLDTGTLSDDVSEALMHVCHHGSLTCYVPKCRGLAYIFHDTLQACRICQLQQRWVLAMNMSQQNCSASWKRCSGTAAVCSTRF